MIIFTNKTLFNSTVPQIEIELSRTGGDKSLVSELRTAHANEKA